MVFARVGKTILAPPVVVRLLIGFASMTLWILYVILS